jgi:hypothetical protein
MILSLSTIRAQRDRNDSATDCIDDGNICNDVVAEIASG